MIEHFSSRPTSMLLVVIALSGGIPPGYAQDAPCTHPACTASQAVGTACRIYLHSEAGEARFHQSVVNGSVGGVSRAQPEGCYDPSRVYGLQGWRFNTRGGHKIQRIAFLQDRGTLDFGLTDGDGGDYMDGFGWLVPLPAGTRERSTTLRSCGGRCRLGLDPMNPNDVFVLRGFEVRRVDGDGHVRRVAIGPVVGTPARPELRVNFRDDDFTYRVRIQYAYLPAGAISESGDVGNTYERRDPHFGAATIHSAAFSDRRLSARTPRGDAVLQSFAFGFRNGGHFLEDVGVERHSNSYEAWFQDNQSPAERREPDDSFSWRARFVILNP
jgi:hypothetical protein